jgi:hypothetical protein
MMMMYEEMWRHEVGWMYEDMFERLHLYEEMFERFRLIACWNICSTAARRVMDYKKNKVLASRVDSGFRAQKAPLRI